MYRLQTLAVAALFVICASVQAQPSRELLLEGKELLTDGSNHDDKDKLLEAPPLFEQALGTDSLSKFARYYAASAASSLANRLLEKEELVRKRTIVEHINYAIDQLKTALDQDEGFADGWVMLAGVYGQKMTVRPLQAVSLGPKFSRAMSRARELEPNNPRVVLMKAITDYNLPRIVGGNKERAVDDLQRTAGLFAEEVVTDPLLPSWGHDETYARLGIAYLDQGDLKAARASFERALEINPEFGWVKGYTVADAGGAGS